MALHFYDFGNFLDKIKGTPNSKTFIKNVQSWAKKHQLKILEFSDDTGELVAVYDR